MRRPRPREVQISRKSPERVGSLKLWGYSLVGVRRIRGVEKPLVLGRGLGGSLGCSLGFAQKRRVLGIDATSEVKDATSEVKDVFGAAENVS